MRTFDCDPQHTEEHVNGSGQYVLKSDYDALNDYRLDTMKGYSNVMLKMMRDNVPVWLPMETAPKDETTILVHDGKSVLAISWTATTEHREPEMRWVLAYWDGRGYAPIPENDLYDGLGTTFLGWQPLPAPPVTP